MPEVREEARSRLISLLSVCDHELASLEALADDRLLLIAQRMREFKLDLVAALDGLENAEP